ncbi:hypothetical protein [Hyphomicrobium sp. ghe19]|uniref:hypothetical protein n=1 Tax=Hyphomicrobium sp. ghe19 TaxID=2682968 RepID=UPI00136706E6|nr:hypothetical protein HYPP_03093 [Hyphomicrobium sp. ghe19]
MKSVASVVVPVVALLAAYGPPAFADPVFAAAEPLSEGSTPLPSFVPSSGQEKYASALHANRGQTVAARQEAEKISALFAGMTTGSISKNDDVAPAKHEPAETDPATPDAEPDPEKLVSPQMPEAQAGRSIMLASNQQAEDTTEKNAPPLKEAPPPNRVKGNGNTHRIPQKALAKATRNSRTAEREERERGTTTAMALASAGHKASVVDLLTNPALWWH